MDTMETAIRTDARPGTPHLARYVSVSAVAVLALSALSACGDDSGTAVEPVGGATAETSPGPAPGATGTTPNPSGDPTRCESGDLDISTGQTQGAAGSRLVDLTFTNISGQNCTLTGYPGVTLVDENGQPIGAAATREDTGGASTVDVEPSGTAVAPLNLSRAENYDDPACDPVPATGLQVIAPDETDETVLEIQATACARDSVELLSVQPLKPAT